MRFSVWLSGVCLLLACDATLAHPKELAHAQWRMRDVAKGTHLGSGDALQLNLRPQRALSFDLFAAACTVTSGGERAVTLALCIPIDATGGTWCARGYAAVVFR
ncbi:MAG TPA: hypothetical protein VGR35_19225 [Tepidisphaeraceae bacterium]|nr:hypothetical protein [Tepidisphaeraceae bacterium]